MMTAQMRELTKEPKRKAFANLTPWVLSTRRISGESAVSGEGPAPSRKIFSCDKGWASLLIPIPPSFPGERLSSSVPRVNLPSASTQEAETSGYLVEGCHGVDTMCHFEKASHFSLTRVHLSSASNWGLSFWAPVGLQAFGIEAEQDPCLAFSGHDPKGGEKGCVPNSRDLWNRLARRCKRGRKQGGGRIESLFSETLPA
jgi:hypothetical protein